MQIKLVQNTSYKIYNASAGSGKTYTLTKEYLKIILSSSSKRSFRQILAITFTNKAVNEMKQRILGSLFEFGETLSTDEASPMFLAISEELQISPADLQKKAKRTLKEILHNYAFFDVSTIDKFTHRLIRTFAKDLKLPQNFEVVLDTGLLLDEAIARLINKAGTNEELTKVLLEFALEKANEDKSWDISLDLAKIGKLLFDENHSDHLKQIADKEITDFLVLKKKIQSEILNLKNDSKVLASSIFSLIDSFGLETTDFPRETLPNHFKRIADGEINAGLYKNQLEQHLQNNAILKKAKSALDSEICPPLLEIYLKIKHNVYQILFLENAYINIVPLTVLNAIQQEVKALELERDQLPISSFNTIISKEIKNQPAPFIYERLGEKYRHYFIDEFQDTSEMQWSNLIPLIGNALESEDLLGQKGSLLLVGDAKQAIYRWRGGKAEQFLNLINLEKNPFVLSPETKNLPANYRSFEEVIKFNNDFFTISSPFLQNTAYNQLFLEGNKQEYNSKKGGLVSLTFIEESEEMTEAEHYCASILKTVHEVREKNFGLKDICILTRNRKHGILIADFLMSEGIPIISSETLLLNSSPKVQFLVALLMHSIDPNNRENVFEILYYLSGDQGPNHHYIAHHLEDLDSLLKNDYNFDTTYLKQHSVYDGLEQAIKQFGLIQGSDAYITYFMDTVLEVEQKNGSSPHTFLAYWEKKKDKLSITAPDSVNAIQIMTVHKSKGLEFPIVIFPFANEQLYKEIDAKLWIPVDSDAFNGFGELLVNKKQEVISYGEHANQLYEEEQHKLELDAFNVLYVALTRSIQALYVLTKKDLKSNGEHKTDHYSGLFIHYLKEKGLWDPSRNTYTFGQLDFAKEAQKQVMGQQSVPYVLTFKDRPSFNLITTSGSLWESGAGIAMEHGNILHQLLGYIKTEADIEEALTLMQRNGQIISDELDTIRATLLQIVRHPNLQEFFRSDVIVWNERDIITQIGLILRPDRIVVQQEGATIIDYKTGTKSSTHHAQVNEYAQAMEDMNFTVKNKIIVYIDETITTEFI
ncbi:UvrD-helicase domain-containing protein [Sediminicola sp. 1XM1-17]|uniref:UvrD-helicase domain-containing protein n=1 Tax=Sediminicola sp. 1XM1-17 TaxID=3127702 RepID=UPI003078917E